VFLHANSVPPILYGNNSDLVN